jgi:hypothetical protein
MKSSIVVFVLAFAAMGLLIGYAASIDVPMQQQPDSTVTTTTGMNSTSSVGIEEQVQADIEEADE